MRSGFLRHAAGVFRGHLPGQLIIQMTDRCNAKCPQCGMRVTEKFKRSTLAMDDMKRSIDAAAERGFTAVSFTGGEPLLMLDELAELIRYAHTAGIPFTRTGTNGHLFLAPQSPRFKDRVHRMLDSLADTPLRNFWVSVDSAVPEVHETMRGFSGVIAGIERALPWFHEAGLYPSANLGINRNIGGDATCRLNENGFTSSESYHAVFYETFRQALREFYHFVIELGFTMVNTCYPMSLDTAGASDGLRAVYEATATDRVVRFTRHEKAMLFRVLLDTVPEYRHLVRIFSPRTSLLALYRQYTGDGPAPYACRGGVDFFFIDAQTGNAFPCGYRGADNFGRFWEMEPGAPFSQPACTACDWECFRDPSELAGPFMQTFSDPLRILARFAGDRAYRKIWFEDLRYYRACRFFDGRRPPESTRLHQFREAGAPLAEPLPA